MYDIALKLQNKFSAERIVLAQSEEDELTAEEPKSEFDDVTDEEIEQFYKQQLRLHDPLENYAIQRALRVQGVSGDDMPDLVGLTIDGADAGYWIWESAMGKYRKANKAMGLSIGADMLEEDLRPKKEIPAWRRESKLQQVARKFANRSTILPPPLPEDKSGHEPETLIPPTIPSEQRLQPGETIPAPPNFPTLPSPASPMWGDVNREVLIGNYQLVLEKSPDRTRQANSVYVKDSDGEIVADWLNLNEGAADLVWNVASGLLTALGK